jgi:hypothetical protein
VLVADRGDEPGIRLLRPDGVRSTPAAMQERCREATAFAGDESGRVYVLDLAGERVQRFHGDLTFDQTVVDLREHLDDFPVGEA